MTSIFLVVNGVYTPASVILAAIRLTRDLQGELQAIFLNANRKGAEGGYPYPNDLSLTQNWLTGRSITEEDQALIESSKALFRKECASAGVPCTVSPNAGLTNEELIQHSVYADLIISDARSPFYGQLVSHALTEASCPVLLLASQTNNFERVVLAFDSSPSSMYAIKMFSYLFPGWASKPVKLLHVVEKGEGETAAQIQANAYLSARFEDLSVTLLHGKVQQTLLDFIKPLGANTLVVLGRYSAGAVGRLFHSSIAEAIVNDTDASVFITHR